MAAFVKSVERFSTTFTASSLLVTKTINLTKGQDETQCVPFYTAHFTQSATDSRITHNVAIDMIDNAGTPAAAVKRQTTASSGGTLVVEVMVVEFESAVTVQKGQTSLTGLNATATITSVTQGNAFIAITQHAQSTGSDDWNDALIQAKFNSNTQIQFDRRAAGLPDWEVYWYVVESNGTDFQTEYVTFDITANATTGTATLSNSVTLANAFLVCTYESSETSDDMRDAIFNFALTASTTLTYYRNHGSTPSATATVGIWVVRSDSAGVNVQRFATDVGSASLTHNQTITSVDLDLTAIISSQNVGFGAWPPNSSTAGGDNDGYQQSIALTTATNVLLTRYVTGSSGSNNNVRYEVVEFQEASTGPTLVADPGAFTWTGTDANLLTTHILTAESGSFLWTGTDAALSKGSRLTADPGSFAWTGTDADLIVTTPADTVLDAEPGSFIWTGTDAGLLVGRAVQAESGSFIWTGTDADLIVTTPGDTVLAADPGSFIWTGTPAALIYSGEPIGAPPAGLPETIRKPKRKDRRYILPDGRVYTDPDRALFELHRLLAENAESGGDLPEIEETPETEKGFSVYGGISGEDLWDQVSESALMQKITVELPDMILARPVLAEPIDPQLISVLFERIDDEEAILLLLDV
ncbi:MAG: hypothetical protein ACR2RF_32295 [Geminicoccaceae bacterium]